MPKKLLVGLAPVLAVGALLAMPALSGANPHVFINGKKAGTKHELGFAFGVITLKNAALAELKCENFSADNAWNEVKEGTERGFEETVGYGTWECKSAAPCEVTNERGIKKEGIYATAEGPPNLVSEKARRNGNTSLPWTGELIEKEPQAGTKEIYVLTHNIKVWIVIPLGTEMGGGGVGPGCVFGGHEIPFFDTEKAPGDFELAPKTINGSKSGLFPSHGKFEGEKTEKDGKTETGKLESEFGAGFTTGSLVTAGMGLELVTAK
jgi:hypothetical protein